jgi:putative ABC transport system ATP-binding protein
MYHDGSLTPPTMRGQGLCRNFGSGEALTTALADVSLNLYPGQVALLMGPSGSGKSTLLAVMSGLMRPDSGHVYALGHDIWSGTDQDRENFRLKNCGFIFQGYNLFPALTARQQLEMILRWGNNTPPREATERANQMLALLGMIKKADLRPMQMSGGEKQRVAIGRALIKEPAFLFADEPTAALDWKHGEQVIDLLHTAAHEQGATVLLVAHDARIIPHADRVFQLEDGVLIEGADRSVAHASHASMAAQY